MSSPETPSFGEVLRAIGRSEKAIDSLGGKIDKLDDKMDGHADAITRHELRLAALEKKDEHEQASRASLSVQVKGALVAGGLAILAAATETVITLAHH